MENLSRRAFASMSAVAAATAIAPGIERRHLVAQGDALQSEFMIDLTLEVQPAHQIGAAASGRLVVPVSGGTFEGPRMKGTIITPGGDWILERPDGSRVLDVRILLQTDDAETIYVSWRGISYTPPGGALFARIVPVFETGAARYSWLNNVVSVGVYRGGGKIAYHIYRIL